MTKSDRKSLIANAAKNAAKKGSFKERMDNATKPGVVRPGKPSSTKIPSALNLTKEEQPVIMEDAVVQTEGTMAEFAERAKKKRAAASHTAPVGEANIEEANVEADKELDESVTVASKEKKEKPAKKEKDPNLLSVSDLARELGIDPKRARARLRASGKAAADGRWPLVARGSTEHDAMSTIIKEKSEGTKG